MSDEQPTLPDPLPSKIKEWLTGQGYPLEMHTLQKCREAGMFAVPSWYYLDQESGDHRETDVKAETPHFSIGEEYGFQIYAVFECKQSRDKPWVVFTDDRPFFSRGTFERQFVPEYVRRWWYALADVIGRHKMDYPLEPTRPLGHTLVRVTFGKSNEDAAYAALMAVTKAAVGTMQSQQRIAEIYKKHFSQPFFELAIVRPVLVLDAPLFSCSLSEDGDLFLQRTDHCCVDWGNKISADQPGSTIIDVVTKQALPGLLAQIRAAAEHLAQIANVHSVLPERSSGEDDSHASTSGSTPA